MWTGGGDSPRMGNFNAGQRGQSPNGQRGQVPMLTVGTVPMWSGSGDSPRVVPDLLFLLPTHKAELSRRRAGIRRAGVSIASNIAEGSKRPDDDFRRFLSYSLGSLAELDTQLIIAEMQGYAPYAHEMKSRIIGLMAAICKFAAALRK